MSNAHHCRYCEQTHKPRFLCDPAKKILDALMARGMSFNMPTIEFPEALPAREVGMGLTAQDSIVGQLVVQAATVPVADVVRPALLFTGRDVYGKTLPRWCYPADNTGMNDAANLVSRMAEMAVRRAAEAR